MSEEASYHRLYMDAEWSAPRGRYDLHALNAPQRAAVLHGSGPLLVLAGAGSGKTRVIIYRMAHLLAQGVAARSILGVTFTNKAARQMRQRLRELVGRGASKVMLATFHGLGLYILQHEYAAVGIRHGFCIYDTSDQLSLVRELMRQVKVADRRLDAQRVLDVILTTKRAGLPEVALDWGDDYELAALELYPRYLEQMRAFNAIDFDDLILRAQAALRVPEVGARWARRFAYLMVDEYQDTSPEQLALVQLLAGSAQNVCAVGDDDQAIYAWRGAAVDNILSFTRHFTATREIVLDQNYRSTGHILAAAHAVICRNTTRKEKRLWSSGAAGEPVEVVACADDDDEAAFACEQIARLEGEGARYGDIAVLYRSNVQSRVLEEALATAQVAYRVVGGQSFFDRKEVRDVMAFLALAHNPADEVALRRIVNVPPRGIGTASLERLSQHASAHGITLWEALQDAAAVPDLPRASAAGAAALVAVMAPAATAMRAARAGELGPQVAALIAALGLRDAVLAADDAPAVAARRLENLDHLQGSVARMEARMGTGEPALARFVRAAALNHQAEDDAATLAGQVTLMTLHSAKGLEFPYVLMVGLEEELLPHRRSLEAGGELSEERRLCYVGMTRARVRLWMTWARHRRRHGGRIERASSRFLEDLPDGPGLRRWCRSAPPDTAVSDARADAFFAKMRAQLGTGDAS